MRDSHPATVGRNVAFAGHGRPLEMRLDPVTGPADGDVLIKVELAGVCGTDAHRLGGDLPAPAVPISFGHEAVGRVAALGAAVHTDSVGVPLAVGDPVYWSNIGSCGRCYACTVQRDPLRCVTGCWPVAADRPNAAGFRDFATVDPRLSLFRIPDDTPLEAVIAFGCAMPTALAGFRRLGAIAPAATVVVQGCGPVGLACTVLAGLSGASQVIVIGAPQNRLAAAGRLGATSVISLDDDADSRRAAVLELTDGLGADVVIEAAGHISAFTEGLDLIGAHGRYLLLGLYSGHHEVPFDPVRVNNLNLSIIGSLGGVPADHLTTVRLAQRHHLRLGLAELITHRFPLERLGDAIVAAGTGDTIKAVIELG
jgi:threonine dehydrogenase-like Zn-dependent dehydrogenase